MWSNTSIWAAMLVMAVTQHHMVVEAHSLVRREGHRRQMQTWWEGHRSRRSSGGNSAGPWWCRRRTHTGPASDVIPGSDKWATCATTTNANTCKRADGCFCCCESGSTFVHEASFCVGTVRETFGVQKTFVASLGQSLKWMWNVITGSERSSDGEYLQPAWVRTFNAPPGGDTSPCDFADNQNCWHLVVDTWEAHITDLSTSTFRIEMKCDVGKELYICSLDMPTNDVDITFNGNKISDMPSSGCHTVTSDKQESANVLEVSATGPKSVQFGELAIVVPYQYHRCEEQKACTYTFFQHFGEHAYMKLQMFPEVQKQCLQRDFSLMSSALQDACETWLECLGSSVETENTLKTLLTAFASPVGALIQGSTVTNQGNSKCFDPRLEDPEEWACDCGPKEIKNCKLAGHEGDAAIQACLKNGLCSPQYRAPGNRKVCSGWTELFCDTSELELSTNVSLKRRAAVKQRNTASEIGDSLDESMEDKCFA